MSNSTVKSKLSTVKVSNIEILGCDIYHISSGFSGSASKGLVVAKMSKWGPGYEISFSFRISNWDTVGLWDNVFVVTTDVHGNDMRHPGLWINNGGQRCNKDSSKNFRWLRNPSYRGRTSFRIVCLMGIVRA